MASGSSARGGTTRKPYRHLSEQVAQAAAAGRNEEGLVFAQKLEGLVKRQQGTQNMNYAGVLHNQGMFLHNLGRYLEAAEKLGAALTIKLRNNNPASTLRTSNILSDTFKALGRNAEATSVAQRALSIGTQAFGPDDPGLSGTLAALGALAVETEKYNEAEEYYARALAIQQKSGNSNPIDAAAAMDQNAHDTQAGGALAQMSARFGAGSDAITAVVRRQQDLKVTLDRLDKRTTAELGAPDGKRNEALIAGLRAESARGQTSLEEATAQITRDFPGYVELASPSNRRRRC